ncbi:MAG: cold shock domain-containing protein [Planctomycetaceae bacterium]|nr:cold shock domain-containing protein [Planctomycetaceae bacterium]
MATGTIKRIVAEKGFGFIVPSDGTEDLFFHVSALESLDFDERLVNRRVEFDQGEDPRTGRSRAVAVRPA